MTNGPFRETNKTPEPERLYPLGQKIDTLNKCYLCKKEMIQGSEFYIIAADQTRYSQITICHSCRDKIQKCNNCLNLYTRTYSSSSPRHTCRERQQMDGPCLLWKQRELITLETLRKKTNTSATNFF